MAGGSALVLLIDEIATMVKVTAEKTEKVKKPVAFAAQQAQQGQAYFKHDTRFILDIAKGSLINKSLLVPAALALNYFLPWAVLPLVAAGGVYFSRAGIKKLRRNLNGETEAHVCREEDVAPSADQRKRKIKEALRTDMILSAEITAITLALVATMPFAAQAAIMSGVAVGATVAAYTVITTIIKMEDLGGWMANMQSSGKVGEGIRAAGRFILNAKPAIMNAISAAGSVAIFMVGGGLMFHGIPALGGGVSEALSSVIASPYLQSAAKLGVGLLAGLGVGAAVYGAEKTLKTIARNILPKKQKAKLQRDCQPVAVLNDMRGGLKQNLTLVSAGIKQRFARTAMPPQQKDRDLQEGQAQVANNTTIKHNR